MKLSLFCSFLALAQGQGPLTDVQSAWVNSNKGNAMCAIDVTKGASNLMDAGFELWAASKRSDQEAAAMKEKGIYEAKLSIDIAAVIASVSQVVNEILAALTDCELLKNPDLIDEYKCGQAATKLTAGATKLTKAVASAEMACAAPRRQLLGSFKKSTSALCVVDVKNAMMTLANAASVLTDDKKGLGKRCEKEGTKMQCADMALRVTSTLASLGTFIMGATYDCTSQKNKDEKCAKAITGVVAALTKMGSGAVEIEKDCKTAANRLFSDGATHIDVPNTFFTPFSVVLVALLPIISVASFLGGRRLQKQQSNKAYAMASVE